VYLTLFRRIKYHIATEMAFRILLLVSLLAGVVCLKLGKARGCTKQLPFDCFIGKGQDYVGLKSRGSTGRVCKNWRDEGTESMATPGIGNHNYCRNPGGSKEKPWCYTVDPAVEWELCSVSECPAEGAVPEPYEAPEGSKLDENGDPMKPCEYEPPNSPGFVEWKVGRACEDSKGSTNWLISAKKHNAADAAGCKQECVALAGSEYFTFSGTADADGNNCGCYRECVLVGEDLTINAPNTYRLK